MKWRPLSYSLGLCRRFPVLIPAENATYPLMCIEVHPSGQNQVYTVQPAALAGKEMHKNRRKVFGAIGICRDLETGRMIEEEFPHVKKKMK